MTKRAVCVLGWLTTVIGLSWPVSAAEPMFALELAERAPERLVAEGEAVAADLTLPGGGGCSETLCLYTWTQTAAGGKSTPNDVFFLRTKLDGEPVDRLGQVLNPGDGEYLGHFDSQVFWTGKAFVVFWRGAKGELRSRGISSEGRLLENEPITLAANVPSGQGHGLNFSAVQTESGFILLWSAVSVAGQRTWHVQSLDRSGAPLAGRKDLAALGTGWIQAARAIPGSNQDMVLAVIGGEAGVPTLVALTPEGQVLKSTRVLAAGTASRYLGASLVPRAGGFWLLRVVYAQGQLTLFRISVQSDGSFDPADERVVGSTVVGPLGWRVRLSVHGNTGLLLWIQGTSSQDPASVLGRRFDVTTGWTDGAAFSVSGQVRTALEDADVFESNTHFISVWNDPVKTNSRSTCARSVPPMGEAGEPSCRIISLNVGFPTRPQLTGSGRGYLIGWSSQERGYQGGGEKRFVRFSPTGVRVDETPFSLARGEAWFSTAGPDQLVVGTYSQYGVTNLMTPPFATTALSERIPYQFGVWTGERHLLVGANHGNLDQRGNALAGRFLRADGTLEEQLAPFGNWSVTSSNPIMQPNVAIGSNGAQHLVVWVHGVPPGLLDVTNNELALLDRNGNVVENFSFGERFGKQELNATACISPLAVVGDAQGFLIACGMQENIAATRQLKLLGYTPGSPPVALGIFEPTGMNRPEVRVTRDGLHVFWSRENEIVQAFLHREGANVSVLTDQHTFPFAPLDPQIAVIDDISAALVYRRGPADGAQLLFRLLDPNASAVDAGLAPVPDAAAPDSALDAASIPDTADLAGAGCSCSTGRGAPPAGSWLVLVLIGLVIRANRRACRIGGPRGNREAVRAPWRAALVLLSLWGANCADPATVLQTDAGAFTDAATELGPLDSGAPMAPIPARPPPGPLPIFTPATPVAPTVPDKIVRINTTVDCDQQVAAQIAGGDHFATLQGALTSAAAGDTVQVCPGQHKGGFLLTRGITLTAYSGDARDTVLDGDKRHLVLTVAIEEGMAPLRLHNLTFRNGRGHQPSSVTGDITGGALLVSSAAAVEISGCLFENNGSRSGGGAIIILRAPTTTVAQTVFRANESSDEGGALSIAFKGAERLVITDSVFENNNTERSGGALSVSHFDINPGPPSITITRTSFLANTSGYGGGAIVVGGGATAFGGRDSHLPMTIEDCRFVGNRAAHSGGAIQTRSPVQTPLVIRNTLADNNFAGVSGSAYLIEEDFSSYGENVAILISGGQVTRNGAGGGAPAIGVTSPAVLKLLDVDLGEGESDNPGGDVRFCPGRYGAHTSLTYPLCI